MVGDDRSSAGSYLASSTSFIPSNCALNILIKSIPDVTSTLRVNSTFLPPIVPRVVLDQIHLLIQTPNFTSMRSFCVHPASPDRQLILISFICENDCSQGTLVGGRARGRSTSRRMGKSSGLNCSVMASHVCFCRFAPYLQFTIQELGFVIYYNYY